MLPAHTVSSIFFFIILFDLMKVTLLSRKLILLFFQGSYVIFLRQV